MRKIMFRIGLFVIAAFFSIQSIGHADTTITNGVGEAFQKSFSYAGYDDFSQSFQVPDEKKMVIEYVSAFITTTEEGTLPLDPPEIPETIPPRVKALLKTTVNGVEASHFWVMHHSGKEGWLTPQSAGGYTYNIIDYFIGAQPLRVYADPGSTVEFYVEIFDGCTNGHCHYVNLSASVTGNLVDLNDSD